MRKISIAASATIASIVWSAAAFANGGLPVTTNIVKSPGHPPLVTMKSTHRAAPVPRDETADVGLRPIANNFTQYANSPYWGWFGYAIFGSNAGGINGTEQWLATAFTPKANSIATRIEVAALHYSGTNQVDLSLYDDAGGLPGKSLRTWHLSNLPTTACCTVVGGSDKSGIPLTAGKQYWVVISTNPAEQSSAAIWGLTEFAGVQKHGSSFAIYCFGSGCAQIGYQSGTWNIIANSLYGLAFSVSGN